MKNKDKEEELRIKQNEINYFMQTSCYTNEWKNTKKSYRNRKTEWDEIIRKYLFE